MSRRGDEGVGAAAETRPKVVYVMGAGRSGTTILGVALGNCDNFVFAGELNQWLPKSGVPTYGGEARERFWDDVRGQVDHTAALGGAGAAVLERSSAVFDPRKWRARRRLRGPYLKLAESLYFAIAHTAEVTHIVDTSHYPLRARELQRLEGIDLHLLYVARDPQGVLASLSRADVPERSFAMPTTNAYLWLTHLMALIAFMRHPRERRLFVTHEDFLADPEGMLRQILRWSGSSATVPELSSLRTGVPLHGNRLVAADLVALKRTNGRPPQISRVTALIQLPWRAIHSRLRPTARLGSSKLQRAEERVPSEQPSNA